MNEVLTARRLFAAAAVLPVLAVGTALVTQHVYGMQPCPWCVLQRAIFLAITLAALAGALGGTLLQRVAALTMLMLAGCGVASALWQHFVAAATVSCNMTLADRIISGLGVDAMWPQVFAPYASCSDAATLLGVPYEFYSLTLFVVLGAAAVHLLRRA